jgi:hypothetical protein
MAASTPATGRALKLDADAARFVPQCLITYFDRPVPTFVGVDTHDELDAGCLPGNATNTERVENTLTEDDTSPLPGSVFPCTSLTVSTYKLHFEALLASEEGALQLDMPNNDMHSARFHRLSAVVQKESTSTTIHLKTLDNVIAAVTSSGDSPVQLSGTLHVEGAPDNAPLILYGNLIRFRPAVSLDVTAVSESRVHCALPLYPVRLSSLLASLASSQNALWTVLMHSVWILAFSGKNSPLHSGRYEIEATVANVRQTIVYLDLPSRIATRTCIPCMDHPTAKQAKADRVCVPCGHRVTCGDHAIPFGDDLCKAVKQGLMSQLGALLPFLSGIKEASVIGRFLAGEDIDIRGFLPPLLDRWGAPSWLPFTVDGKLYDALSTIGWCSACHRPVSAYLPDTVDKGVASVPALMTRQTQRLDPTLAASMMTLPFHVRFEYPRSNLRTMRSALRRACLDELKPRLFPELPSVGTSAHAFPPTCSRWFHEGLNETQREAVEWIVTGDHGDIPYLLIGPAGTGKTTTLTEAVLQVLDQLRDHATRVLLIAPSDAAADLLLSAVDSLLHLLPKMEVHNILRVCLPTRMLESLAHVRLQKYCIIENARFAPIGRKHVENAKLLVATAHSLAMLPAIALHLSHLFVDEASQALEPELLLPLMLCDAPTRVILSGDPRQLGPTVVSAVAAARGLDVSLQERLLLGKPSAPGAEPVIDTELTPEAGLVDVVRNSSLMHSALAHSTLPLFRNSSAYQLDGKSGPKRLSAVLTVNYRSHPLILQLASRMFYGNSLVSAATAHLTSGCENWRLLHPVGARKDVPASPVVCVGVRGHDAHLVDSPSYWNDEEAQAVVWLVQSMLGTAKPVDMGAFPDFRPSSASRGKLNIDVTDICVIALYRQQVLRIRDALRAVDLGSVQVGTIANFQGRERHVVILSTVLSKNYGLKKSGTAPFADPRAFNVAITRAQSLLVCVGDPDVLALNPQWRELLQYSADHATYRGWKGQKCPLEPSSGSLWAISDPPSD